MGNCQDGLFVSPNSSFLDESGGRHVEGELRGTKRNLLDGKGVRGQKKAQKNSIKKIDRVRRLCENTTEMRAQALDNVRVPFRIWPSWTVIINPEMILIHKERR